MSHQQAMELFVGWLQWFGSHPTAVALATVLALAAPIVVTMRWVNGRFFPKSKLLAEAQAAVEADRQRLEHENALLREMVGLPGRAIATVGAATETANIGIRQISRALRDAKRGDYAAAMRVLRGVGERQAADAAKASTAADEKRLVAAETYRQLGALASMRDTEAALAAYRRAAELDPSDAWTWIFIARLEWQAVRFAEAEEAALLARDAARAADAEREVMVAENAIGDIYIRWQKPNQAEVAFAAGKEMAKRLAASDPIDSERQRDFTLSLNKIGDVRMARDDFVGASRAYDEALAIRIGQVALEPSNTGFQRDLSVSLMKLGDLRMKQKPSDAVGALEAYEEALSIRQRLAASNPRNLGWQRDLSLIWQKLGEAKETLGDSMEALQAWETALAIIEPLAVSDLGNAIWQRDLIVSHWKIADLVESVPGREADSIGHWTAALNIAASLEEMGQLAPADDWFGAELVRRLAQAEREKRSPKS